MFDVINRAGRLTQGRTCGIVAARCPKSGDGRYRGAIRPCARAASNREHDLINASIVQPVEVSSLREICRARAAVQAQGGVLQDAGASGADQDSGVARDRGQVGRRVATRDRAGIIEPVATAWCTTGSPGRPCYPQDARAPGCLGYVARAGGLRTDARLGHPCTALPVTEVGATAGDVLARYAVRRDEFAASTELACNLIQSQSGPT